MTPYQKLKRDWKDCTECPLCDYRSKVVFGKGVIGKRCEVLYVGEAPGDSEDDSGIPFDGPAGDLLDKIRYRAAVIAGYDPPSAFFNTVGCIPKPLKEVEGVTKRVKRDPKPEEVKKCAPRLESFYEITRPRAIVTLGGVSKKWTPKILEHPMDWFVHMVHPAAIIGGHITQKGLAIQRCEVQLVELFHALKEERE